MRSVIRMSQVSQECCDLNFQGLLFSCHELHLFLPIPVITIKVGLLIGPFFMRKSEQLLTPEWTDEQVRTFLTEKQARMTEAVTTIYPRVAQRAC